MLRSIIKKISGQPQKILKKIYQDLNISTGLVNRYYRDDDLKERLILNHIIILGNVLGPDVCAEILMSKTHHNSYRSIIKTFLVYLNYLPEEDYVEVPMDATIIDVLRKL